MTSPPGRHGAGRRCSFCGKPNGQVESLIAGPGRVFICDQCVQLCHEIMTAKTPASPVVPSPDPPPTPREIHRLLGEYVIGQDRAKKVLSVAVYNHYKRSHSDDPSGAIDLEKANILFIGPTGCGKTLLAQTLAKILQVPYAIADATSLTEAGYVGEDVENILLRLIQAADFDIARAERGIIYIDEIDKIGRKAANPSITRDVSGEGVQQGLLKIIEGCVANVPPQGGRKHPQQELIQIRTENILFICGGAFEGLKEIVDRRCILGGKALGFRSWSEGSYRNPTGLTDPAPQPDDLLNFGFIPEFIGRLSMLVNLEPLGKDSLMQVLTEPKNALVKQYQELFRMDGVDLTFTHDALDATAETALRGKTGARGLRGIIESTLLDIMYELPSLPEASRCIVDGDAIRGHGRPLLLSKGGVPILENHEESA